MWGSSTHPTEMSRDFKDAPFPMLTRDDPVTANVVCGVMCKQAVSVCMDYIRWYKNNSSHKFMRGSSVDGAAFRVQNLQATLTSVVLNRTKLLDKFPLEYAGALSFASALACLTQAPGPV